MGEPNGDRGAFGGDIWLFGLAFAPTIGEQYSQFAEHFPVLVGQARALVDQLQSFSGWEDATWLERLLTTGRELLSGSAVSALTNVGLTVAATASLGLVALIATVYLVIQPEPWVNGFVSLFPAGWRERVREVLGMMYHTTQKWVLGQLASMTVIGVLSTVALYIIGVPFALLLGIFSGLVSFIPYAGPIISVVPRPAGSHLGGADQGCLGHSGLRHHPAAREPHPPADSDESDR